jgi:hypothetical protein
MAMQTPPFEGRLQVSDTRENLCFFLTMYYVLTDSYVPLAQYRKLRITKEKKMKTVKQETRDLK